MNRVPADWLPNTTLLITALVMVSIFQGTTRAETPNATAVNFAREVLPVLSNKCFVCHGPDSIEDTDLRLDSFAAATADRGGYRVVDIATPAESELLARILSKDDPMPPADAERQLTDAERDVLKRWVEQGGQYAKHWAFEPARKRTPFGDATEAIDQLLGRRLQDQGLGFSDAATPDVLARRVALVLTGLPPSADLRDAYLKDPSDQAYGVLVDQLLADPRYGEHQARYWLDAVRYGDTHGLHLDNRRGIYPYRDWVVRAMNSNLPIDDFITWQLAGDLLDQPTLEQRVATGFVRLNPTTGEGGAIPEEFQMKNNFDRVETLGTVFLGMSLTCARCHTHKYDPIEQTEYYRLMSFFNNTAEPSMDRNAYEYGPTVKAPQDQPAWQQWLQLQDQAKRLISSVPLTSEARQNLVDFATQQLGWKADHWKLSGPQSKDVVSPPALEDKAAGWADGKGLPGSINGRAAKGKLPGANQRVFVTFDVTVPRTQTLHLTFGGGKGSHVLVDDRNVPVAEKSDRENRVMPLALEKGKHRVCVVVEGFDGISEIRVELVNLWDSLAKNKDWDRCSLPEKIRMLSSENNPLEVGVDPKAAEVATQLTATESQFTTTLVAQELSSPRKTFVLRRGEYDSPLGEPVQPGTLKVMGDLPKDAPRNRLGLAQWLTADEHPLVARVFVNRLWQRTFGHGLVRTPEDFGLQGEQPTHPELLDWLAVDFQQNQWNLKQMLKAMVMTDAFRQSSAWRNGLDDPENRLFARGSSYRLDAEVLRDIGLWASGLLDPHMGGEGVKPYQPGGMWLALAHPGSNTKNYVQDKGSLLFRRSLYVYWKRTSPHPMMTLFDAPDRESSCVRRSRTNTPLQSLGMLNETQRIEMGRGLATRVLENAASDEARVDYLFRMLACRDATDSEQVACRKLIEGLRKRYAAQAQDAASLLAVGEAPVDEGFSPAELASWAQLSTTVLASDVAILLY